MILAADIGGTRSRLLLAQPGSGSIIVESEYASGGFPNLEAVITRFLEEQQQPTDAVSRVVLALAGPVTGDCVALTNLPWLVCRRSLQKQLPKAKIHFLNDFQAAALGTLEVDESSLLPVQATQAKEGERKLVLGAGTGLGVAYLHPQHGSYHPWATEAGHMSFAPQNHRQCELAEYLREKYGRVSWERVLSGNGLVDLHAFLSGGKGLEDPATVTEAAQRGEPLAAEAATLFSEAFGTFCGDLALAWQPAGGIYLTGGVTTHLTQWLTQPGFLDAYRNKGRMSALVADIPIHIVMEPRVGLLGALRHALQQEPS